MDSETRPRAFDSFAPTEAVKSLPMKRPRGNPNWLKGKKPDGAGRKPNSGGLQDPSPRLKFLVDQHGIGHILKAMEDQKYLEKNFSTYDGLLIMGLANGLKGDGLERERILDRMFGKVPDRSVNLNINIDTDPDQLSDKAMAMLARLED